MDIVILGLAKYLIKIKRYKRFEWTIIVLMFSKHTLKALYEEEIFQIIRFRKWIHEKETRYVLVDAF